MQEGRMYLTEAGRRLLAKGQAGNSLRFTRFVLGDGIIENVEEMLSMAELKSQKMSLGFREGAVKVNADGTATISVLITNSENDQWLDLREFGIYAQDPDVGEVLYAVGSNASRPDPIPPSKMKMWEMQMDIIVQIGNVENLTINIDRSMTYVTYEEFWDLAGEGRTHQTVKRNWDLIQDLRLKILGFTNANVDGKEANVLKISHKDIGPTERVDGVYFKKEGAFVI